ncbi:hypothetical protein ACRPFF_11800 [Neisseria sp. SLRRB23]|uniref:hypothetical protein n=1 Tax=Neisseria sp. SLRRB23 TaxID=3435199 RepID=UPI003D7FFD6C
MDRTIWGRITSFLSMAQINGNITVGQSRSFDTAPLGGRLNLTVADAEVFRNFCRIQ